MIAGTCGRLDAQTAGWKFGDQLSGKAKMLYESLEKNYSALKDFGEYKGIDIQFDTPIAAVSERELEWYRVQRAFLMDHSELFWIRSLSMSLTVRNGAASEMLVYAMDRYADIRKETADASRGISKAIAAVKKRKGRYAKVKAAHDYVVRLTTYPKNPLPEYYHAVTGPLLNKYAHRGVCEAYAWLFDIICKANGIPCVTLEGNDHAWNYVQMEDGKWYLVDTTKDDGAKISYDYFLVGANTSVHGKKVKNTHRAASTAKLYKTNNVAPLKYPALSKTAYKKSGSVKKVTAVRIKSAAKTVKAGKKLKLKATIVPGNASNKKVKWSSSNKKYATVTSKGVVKAKKAGKGKTVKITAKAMDGSKKKAAIRIKIK